RVGVFQNFRPAMLGKNNRFHSSLRENRNKWQLPDSITSSKAPNCETDNPVATVKCRPEQHDKYAGPKLAQERKDALHTRLRGGQRPRADADTAAQQPVIRSNGVRRRV